MAQILVNLPRVKGNIKPDITFSIDESIPEEKKLPVCVVENLPLPIAMIKQNALFWAIGKFSDYTARQLFLNGISGIIDCGLLCESDGLPDGDWVKSTVTFQATEAAIKSMVKILNIESMKNAIEVAIATKVDFWSTNNLIGQGQVAGYTKDVLETLYPYDITDQVVSAARLLGCYTSTLYVLRLAGIAGIRDVNPFVKNEGTNFTLSNNLKPRFQTMPAGTQKLDIAYNAAKKLIRSQPRTDYQDSDMDNYLGRLGTFIITLYEYSTMAKSSHMTRERVENYPDYDIDFKEKLIQIKTSKQYQEIEYLRNMYLGWQ